MQFYHCSLEQISAWAIRDHRPCMLQSDNRLNARSV